MSPEYVDVVIPTLALHERRDLVRRAVASVLEQQGAIGTPIVVLNGSSYDEELVAELEANPRVRLIRQQHPSIPDAMRLGLANVTAPWFTALDDDDLLCPHALATRVDALRADGRCNAVVTNGIVRTAGADELIVPDMRAIGRDPLHALLDRNWLLPGSWLCAADDEGKRLFDGMPAYLECTYIAIQLATNRRTLFLDEPTVVWHTNSPASVSRSIIYRVGQEPALRRVLELDLPDKVRRGFRRRLGASYHECAQRALAAGRRGEALVQHVRSILSAGGWRYLTFTWRLISGPHRAE